MKHLSVCIIASGIEAKRWRLQPWRYFTEVACQLADLGHSVKMITDGTNPAPKRIDECKVEFIRVPSVKNLAWMPNRQFIERIKQASPNVVIWNLGLTSLLHEVFPSGMNMPVVGLLTSPIYRPREIIRMGLRKILKSYRLSGAYLVCSLEPDWFIRKAFLRTRINHLAVQTQTTKTSLEQARLWPQPVRAILPGVDGQWLNYDGQNSRDGRGSREYSPGDLVLLYYGSPAEWRGLLTLIKAMDIARRSISNLRLEVLSRSRANEWSQEENNVLKFIADHQLEPYVSFSSGFLDPEKMVKNVAAADIIVLPFELLPSDAPISVLEAVSLGKPVITTRLACLPELASYGESYLAQPGDPESLAGAIRTASANRHENSALAHAGKTFARGWPAVGGEWSDYLQNL